VIFQPGNPGGEPLHNAKAGAAGSEPSDGVAQKHGGNNPCHGHRGADPACPGTGVSTAYDGYEGGDYLSEIEEDCKIGAEDIVGSGISQLQGCLVHELHQLLRRHPVKI
jgi:hypothetical protein